MTREGVVPMDVSDIRDPGMKAVVLLAGASGWNVMHKPNNPYNLFSPVPGEMSRTVPTNTSIRQKVFEQHVRSVFTFAAFDVTEEDIEQVIQRTRLDRSRATVLRRIHDEFKVPEPEAAAEPPAENIYEVTEAETAFTREVQAMIEEPLPEEWPKRYPYRVEYLPRGDSRWRGSKGYTSNHVEVWEQEDGTRTLHCIECGWEGATAKSVGGHSAQIHGKKGPGSYDPVEVPTIEPSHNKEDYEPLPPTTEVVDLAAKAAREAAEATAEQQVAAIWDVIAPPYIRRMEQLQIQLRSVTDDRDHWKHRAEKAEGDLNALREMLNG